MSDIVIIGAGIGGLTAAIRLAVAGHHVTVLEKNGQVENRTIYAAITSTFMRPHNRCPDVRGLYFAGGTTHPGAVCRW